MFREINQIENTMISKTLSLISPQISKELNIISYKMWVYLEDSHSRPFFPKIFLIPNDIAIFLQNKLQEGEFRHAGIFFGTIKRGDFLLSLEGAEFLYYLGCFPKRQIVVVNESGEKASLYRNDIFGEMIKEISNEISKEGIVLVINKLSEVISLARYPVPNMKKPLSSQLKLITLIDKGYYLREKQ